ncbi:MAG: gamma-glutamylcyclotransferase, partial [Phycisphaerae bacterium]|nr:gamma-glutamylcyclotransferase [Phycisphaerae bacterium]
MTESKSIVNFAYGSNLLTRRIRARAPHARVLSTGTVRGWELRWHMASQDGSGKCDMVRSSGEGGQVLGVLYEVPAEEKRALDAAETLGHGYAEHLVQVETPSGTIEAWAYRALVTDPDSVPYDW